MPTFNSKNCVGNLIQDRAGVRKELRELDENEEIRYGRASTTIAITVATSGLCHFPRARNFSILEKLAFVSLPHAEGIERFRRSASNGLRRSLDQTRRRSVGG
jgi:hypothetical protein